MKPKSRRSDASDVAIHLRSQVCLVETPNNSNLPTMMHQIAFSFVESSLYSTASKTKIPPQPSQAESKEVESAVNLFQFEQGFQRNHLEAGNLNKFAKGLNIYFPSHLLKKNKDICFSTTLFYPVRLIHLDIQNSPILCKSIISTHSITEKHVLDHHHSQTYIIIHHISE